MELNETARRIRVAMTYGGFRGRRELAKAIESSAATLQRIEGVAEPARPPKRSELLAISDATGVPMWFLEDGWEGWRASEPPSGGDGSEKERLRGRDLHRRRGGGEGRAESA